MSHLISLKENDALARSSMTDPLLNAPRPNGVRCPNPKCGKELVDVNPIQILMSMPPRKAIRCVKCGFTGTRLV